MVQISDLFHRYYLELLGIMQQPLKMDFIQKLLISFVPVQQRSDLFRVHIPVPAHSDRNSAHS